MFIKAMRFSCVLVLASISLKRCYVSSFTAWHEEIWSSVLALQLSMRCPSHWLHYRLHKWIGTLRMEESMTTEGRGDGRFCTIVGGLNIWRLYGANSHGLVEFDASQEAGISNSCLSASTHSLSPTIHSVYKIEVMTYIHPLKTRCVAGACEIID